MIYGCFFKPPFHTPKWSFLVGKPMVVAYHHFRKPLYIYYIHLFIIMCVFLLRGSVALPQLMWGPGVSSHTQMALWTNTQQLGRINSVHLFHVFFSKGSNFANLWLVNFFSCKITTSGYLHSSKFDNRSRSYWPGFAFFWSSHFSTCICFSIFNVNWRFRLLLWDLMMVPANNSPLSFSGIL